MCHKQVTICCLCNCEITIARQAPNEIQYSILIQPKLEKSAMRFSSREYTPAMTEMSHNGDRVANLIIIIFESNKK